MRKTKSRYPVISLRAQKAKKPEPFPLRFRLAIALCAVIAGLWLFSVLTRPAEAEGYTADEIATTERAIRSAAYEDEAEAPLIPLKEARRKKGDPRKDSWWGLHECAKSKACMKQVAEYKPRKRNQ